MKPAHETDVGDFVIAVLAGSLAEVRDALAADGFDDAAELVADFVDAADHHLGGKALRPGERGPADTVMRPSGASGTRWTPA